MTKPIEKWATYAWPRDEEWKPIPGFPGYEASDAGRIRSLRRSNARLVNPEIDDDGYERLSLTLDGSRVHQLVSRLAATTFIGPAPVDKPKCCHNDNNTRNNRPSNLRWDTQAGNIADKALHGTDQIGSRHPRASMDEGTARTIKTLFASIPYYKGKLKEIARISGASYQAVSGIVHKGTWRHV